MKNLKTILTISTSTILLLILNLTVVNAQNYTHCMDDIFVSTNTNDAGLVKVEIKTQRQEITAKIGDTADVRFYLTESNNPEITPNKFHRDTLSKVSFTGEKRDCNLKVRISLKAQVTNIENINGNIVFSVILSKEQIQFLKSKNWIPGQSSSFGMESLRIN